MRGLISAGGGEMVRLKKVLLKKIDGVHNDVRTMEDIMRARRSRNRVKYGGLIIFTSQLKNINTQIHMLIYY